MTDQDVIYFNNCRGRDHAVIFGQGAFFDLGVGANQSKHLKQLQIGQECVVASYAEDGRIVFKWYALTRETIQDNEHFIPCHVFYGDLLSTETLEKSAAADTEEYGAFFNVNGHFKRPSVLSGPVAGAARPRSNHPKASFCPEEIDVAAGPFIEGATYKILVNSYERNAAARSTCLRHHGTTCLVCGFNFAAVYGPQADGYIHVHHLKPLSEIQAEYQIDPVNDLCPVCPNCHAMLHLGGITRTVTEVKAMLTNQESKKGRTRSG
jgi:hypothetical protein